MKAVGRQDSAYPAFCRLVGKSENVKGEENFRKKPSEAYGPSQIVGIDRNATLTVPRADIADA